MAADVRLAGAAMTPFGKSSRGLLDLAADAGRGALGQARPDRLLVAAQAPEAFTGQGNLAAALADRLGLSGVPATRLESGPSSGGAALQAAWMAIASGKAQRVLVVGCEQMTTLPHEDATKAVATLTAPEERAAGLSMPALAALMARAAMARGLTREDLAAPTVAAHEAALRHERAHLRKAVTLEDVLASPLVADPLRVLDCAPMSDGAAAVLLAKGEGPVRVAGLGHATDRLALAAREGPDALTSFAASRAASLQAHAEAGWGPAQVDYAELHDAFSIVALCSVEDLGLCVPGHAAAVWRGEEGPALNRGGGLKARGHPVGATGVAQAVEAFEQLTGAAGPRQVDGVRRALLHNIGGLGNNVLVTLLEAAP
jgi:acetyl-CoA C-acetyltransferase